MMQIDLRLWGWNTTYCKHVLTLSRYLLVSRPILCTSAIVS